VALAGVFIWARGVNFDLPEMRLSLPKLRARGDGEPEAIDEVVERPARAEPAPRKVAVPIDRPGPLIADRAVAPSPAKPKEAQQTSLDLRDNYRLPPLELLKPSP